jgi:signal transduction histidine kinase/CheY-like chemotaxis protein/HPt (histidine-containing phosphotransfer) domain-containing protein
MNWLPRDGIVNRSILITLLAFLVAGIGALTYTSYTTAQRATRTIDTRLNQLLDTVQSTVKIACFLKDTDLAKEVSMGLLSNSEVLRVTILADGATLVDESRTNRSGSPTPSDYPLNPLERKIHSPFTPGKIVGTVRLEPNPEVIAAQRSDDILLAVKQLAWQLLLVSGAIVTALIVFVVRPISRMSLALHKMDATTGTRLFIPPGHENTEIGRLVTDVNQLADHLVSALNEARQARLDAEAASDAKSLFLANMSHEIRTPLTAVQGFARIGARDSQDPVSRENFTRILDAGTHLLGVINDILDFSKIEAGKLFIETRPCRLTEITTEAISLMLGRAAEKGLDLTHRPSPDLPEWVSGDPMRIRQILVNLLSNAIKFSRHGTIDLTVLRAEDEIWFAIRDEGIGMTDEEISRLFRPFEQADSSTTRKYGGTGLGLSISMNLASLMGGTIQVTSTPWRGSTFTLQLPLREVAAPVEGAAAHETPFNLAGQLAGFHILAAEDIEANRLILADMLDEAGATYIFAENGRAALEQVVADPGAFNVVLMDVQMPEMDGNEATRRIHEVVPTLTVIGLTAHGLMQDRATSLAAGMKDHVTKPIDPQALVTAILTWATPGRITRELSRPIVEPTTAPPSVLLSAPGSGEVDWATLNKRFKGKRSFIHKIVQSTLTGHADAPEQLRKLAAARDYEALAFLTHSLKGVFGNLAATPSQEFAAQVETAARHRDEACFLMAGELADRIIPLFAELERYLATP